VRFCLRSLGQDLSPKKIVRHADIAGFRGNRQNAYDLMQCLQSHFIPAGIGAALLGPHEIDLAMCALLTGIYVASDGIISTGGGIFHPMQRWFNIAPS